MFVWRVKKAGKKYSRGKGNEGDEGDEDEDCGGGGDVVVVAILYV